MTTQDYLAREARKLGHPLSVLQARAVVAELRSLGVLR